jgi:HSP20 family protein
MTRLLNVWNPWTELERMRQEVNRCFPRRFRGDDAAANAVAAVNVAQGEHTVVVTSEIPGVEPKDLDVTVTAGTLTIRARRPDEQLGEGENWLVRERPRGVFERTIELPFEVDTGNVEATFENGVLTLRLQRPEEQRPRKVEIKAV